MTKKKTSILALVITAATVGLLINTISISNVANAQEGTIPEWIQNIALFWGQGDISESEFVNALEFLGDEGILSLPVAESAEAQEITRSLEDLEERIDKIETNKSIDTQSSPTQSPSQETGEGSDRRELIMIMEDRGRFVTHPYDVKAELASMLDELGYTSFFYGKSSGPILTEYIEIIDIDYSVICAAHPGLADSQSNLTLK